MEVHSFAEQRYRHRVPAVARCQRPGTV